MHDGFKGRRLGQVNGLTTATFVLTEADAPIAADVQFLAASFVRGGHSVLSDPVIVRRGATYDWKLLSAYGHDAITANYSTR
jgi:type IV secretory pathway TrbF-like protein